MTGISAYGCYVPPRRMSLSVLSGRPPKDGGPEKAVAWSDEDSITMSVEAARQCLTGRGRDKIGLVILATTTHAFDEKQGAVIVARALGLDETVRTMDIGHSLRGGSQALLSAIDAVKAGSVKEALVVAADCRLGAPGSSTERNGGDAAAAFLIGQDGVIAELSATAQCGLELVDVWRRSGDRFVHSWEERFVVQHGYLPPAQAAGEALKTDDIGAWRWVLSAPDARSHGTLVHKLGLSKDQVEDPLFGRVGYAGAAHAGLQLVSALDKAEVGQSIAVVNHGDGAEALAFKMVGQGMIGQGVGGRFDAAVSRKPTPVKSLDQYRKARGLEITEYPAIDDQGVSATVHFRDRAENISLAGQVCECGEPQFPKGRVCIRCGQMDQWSERIYAESGGAIVTYTLDAFFPSPEPPTAVAIVQVNDGPRIHMQVTDVAADDVAIRMPVDFVFRRIHQVGQRPNYFWKCTPAEESQS